MGQTDRRRSCWLTSSFVHDALRGCARTAGGAGAISREFNPERKEYLEALRRALEAGRAILAAGGSAVDAAAAAVEEMENEPLFNAGVGSVLTADGRHELDAGVMRGSDSQAGAVAAVRTIEHPVRLAQLVMSRSPHVLLVGEGAEAFARLQGVPMVDNSLFTTPARLQVHHELLEQARKMQAAAQQGGSAFLDVTDAPSVAMAPTATPNPPLLLPVLDHSVEVGSLPQQQKSGGAGASAGGAHLHPHSSVQISMSPFPADSASPAPIHFGGAAAATAAPSGPSGSASAADSDSAAVAASSAHPALAERKYGTVGAVALDVHGELATAISTGGMSLKAFGRVGDSALIGSGFYADPHVAVACTGHGEAFMRAAVAKDVSALMEYKGLGVVAAADAAMRNGENKCGRDFEGGLIAVDREGHIAMPYNSKGMYRGSVTSDKEPFVAVWRD